MSRKLTTAEFIEKAQLIHGNKYDYSKVEYINNKTKVCIICHEKDENGIEHGEFWQKPNDHISSKAKCPKCNYMYMRKLKAKTKEQFIKEAKEIHNNKYNYSKVNYINTNLKVIITCPKHGDFELTPHNHLSGLGCPKCKLKSQTKFYKKLKEIFPKENIIFETGKEILWLEGLRFDIYFPKYNIAIEYNGELHYIPKEYFGGKIGLEEIQKRDELKRQKCKENNCTLFEVKYNYTEEDYKELIKNIENIIKNYDRR